MKDMIPHAQPPPELRARRLWQWRRNPLRRPADRLKAWIALALTAAVLAAAPVTMLLVNDSVDRSLRQTAHAQAESRHRTTAVLLHDAPQHLEPGSDEADHARYPAEVRFTDATGQTRTAETDVPAGLPAGGTLQVWSNANGDLTDPPMPDGQIRSRTLGWVAATGITVAFSGVAVYVATSYALKRRSLTEWGKSWDDTAPRWTTSLKQ